MSPALSLAELAYRVDDYLMRPVNMVATRARVEDYLDGSTQGPDIITNRLPCNPAYPGDFSDMSFDEENRNLHPLTVDQTAAVLAALHDAHCPGVEKVLMSPDLLPRRSTVTDLQRTRKWYAIVDAVQELGEYSLPWFSLQFLRFIQNLPEKFPFSSAQSDLVRTAAASVPATVSPLPVTGQDLHDEIQPLLQPIGTEESEAGKPADEQTNEILPALLSISDIANRIKRKTKSVGSFLGRYAKKYPDCREEIDGSRMNEPKHLYRTAEIWPALENWMKNNQSE